jgi:Protein of unknown function DUF262
VSYVDTSTLKNSTIIYLYTERQEIDPQPEYQREGGIWTLEKRRLLIDSIINDYDLPKIYFHILQPTGTKEEKKFAIIDGRQRLETIWDFIDGKFTLADDFEYQRDDKIKLAKLSYKDIADNYPKIKVKFDSFVLPIVTVSVIGDDSYIIEDMFSRLNEAVALNAAEKRNAIGGDMVRVISRISKHEFFSRQVKFKNNRYQHRESAARFALIEDFINPERGMPHLVDTKKVFLDELATKYKSGNKTRVGKLESLVTATLDEMSKKFTEQDEILAAQGTLVVYYLVFKAAMINGELARLNRRKLLDFRTKLAANRSLAANDITKANFDFLEFDRLNQQGTNDASSIRERARIIGSFLKVSVLETLGLDKSR